MSNSSKRNYVDSMTTSVKSVSRLWRPHNYRRGVEIKVFDNSMFSKKGFIVGTTIPYSKAFHTRIISVRFDDNITVQIFKTHIVAIWKQNVVGGVKETFLLKGESFKEVNAKISGLKDYVYDLLDSAMGLVIDRVGFVVVSNFYLVRGENWTRGDYYVDKLPADCIIHEDRWKKVYKRGIEVIGGKGDDSVEFLRNHINNSILFDFAPLIAEELVFNRLLAYDIKAWCDKYINSLVDFNIYEKVIKRLPVEARLEMSLWAFERFNSLKGGVNDL